MIVAMFWEFAGSNLNISVDVYQQILHETFNEYLELNQLDYDSLIQKSAR